MLLFFEKTQMFWKKRIKKVKWTAHSINLTFMSDWPITRPITTHSKYEKGDFHNHREYMQCFLQKRIKLLKFSNLNTTLRNPSTSRLSLYFSDKILYVAQEQEEWKSWKISQSKIKQTYQMKMSSRWILVYLLVTNISEVHYCRVECELQSPEQATLGFMLSLLLLFVLTLSCAWQLLTP